MADTLSLRCALPSERGILEELQRRASLANPGDRDAILAHPDAIEIPLPQLESGQVFVAEHGAAILGFAALHRRADGDMDLDALFVEPSLWRQGIGRRLVGHCEQVARSLGANALYVIGNPHAAQFYVASGFDTLGSCATRFGEGIVYRRALGLNR